MGLTDFLTAGRVPRDLVGRPLILATAEDLLAAEDFLNDLETALGPLACAVLGDGPYAGPRPAVDLPAAAGADRKRLRRLRPQRIIVLGHAPGAAALIAESGCRRDWINARDAEAGRCGCTTVSVSDQAAARVLPEAELTGDPLLGLEKIPAAAQVGEDLCERFDEYRERGHGVFYAACTGEGEEAVAYGCLFEVLRRATAIMILAPRDPARYEPVYRDAIKYSMPTIRHSRLMTSFVPRKNRVYFVETEEALAPLYPCAEVVLPGGTLSPASGLRPDLLTPMAQGRAVLAGPVADAWVRSAAAAGVIATAEDVEALAARLLDLLQDPDATSGLGAAGKVWLEAQVGAAGRVLGRIVK